MKRPESVLVVIERAAGVSGLMRKAVALAKPLGARMELFLCDSEQAYVLGHAYDREGILAARTASVAAARRYLGDVRAAAAADEVAMSIDAECESPLYESVVRKVQRSAPDVVIKAMATPDPNDWQLMRTCPTTLLLLRPRAWCDPPRFAAAIDVSEVESADLARSVAETARTLAAGYGAELHVLYGEPGSAVQSAARLEKLRGICAEAGVAGECMHVLTGRPEQSLAVFAREQRYDALILGALAHRSAGTTPVGTLTTALLDALECDFVLVKPPSYRSPIDTFAG